MKRFHSQTIEFVNLQSVDSWNILHQNCIDKCRDVDVVFWTTLWENTLLEPVIPVISRMVDAARSINPQIKIILVASGTEWYHKTDADILSLQNSLKIDQIIYLDFFLLLVHHRIFCQHESIAAPSWKTDIKKCLFLTGKPQKRHRIRLLYKLISSGLKPNLVWSLFMSDGTREEAKSYLPELTQEQFDKFVQEHLRNPDQVSVERQYNSFHYSGIPFTTSLYHDCLFQIISETHFTRLIPVPWITEKTWLSIANRRPFIMAGEPGTLQRLTALGFRTFEKYLFNPEYDTISDSEKRLDAIVENAVHWIDAIETQKSDIMDDVEHNFNRFVQMVDETKEKINQTLDSIGVTADIAQILSLKDDTRNLRYLVWYEKVRGPDWPDCQSEMDFFKLPAWVQKEFIEVFGYIPPENI